MPYGVLDDLQEAANTAAKGWLRSCCPRSLKHHELVRSATCFQTDDAAPSCDHDATSAQHVLVFGAHCAVAAGSRRGFFVRSRARSGKVVCTGGDTYRVYVSQDANASSLHSAFGIPVGDANSSAVYFIDVDAGLRLPGNETYSIKLVLQETQRRAIQRREGVGILRWSASDGGSPTRDWLRYRECVDSSVHLPEELRALIAWSPPAPEDEPQCGALHPSTPTALVALGVNDTCGGWRCIGDGHRRLVARIPPWSNPRELPDRVRLGYKHVLKPDGCRLRLYDNASFTSCLRGRSLLNIGGSAANALQRGIERVSGLCKNWWFNYVRTIGDVYDQSPGVSVFGKGRVVTQFLHHPFRYGLLNVIDPGYVVSTSGKHMGPRGDRQVKPHTPESYERMLAGFEIVVFESGVHDISFPDVKGGISALLQACTGPAPCADADILPLLHNESFRLDLLAAYRLHLNRLMAMWTRVRERRSKVGGGRPSRLIFKLAYAPAHHPKASGCASPFGYNVFASYMKEANEVARRLVEAAGFEVFDPFPVTMHAMKHWFDQGGRDLQHADSLSDLVTQVLLNQLCGPR